MRKMLREGAAFRIRRSELGAGTRKWVLRRTPPAPSLPQSVQARGPKRPGAGSAQQQHQVR